MRSDNVTKGSERAPNRSLFYALGYTPEELERPLIGVVSAKRILVARRGGALRAEDLKKLGVVLKRAQYFLTCSGRSTAPLRLSLEGVRRNLTATERASLPAGPLDQLSLFEPA